MRAEDEAPGEVFGPAVAGIWYPADPADLAREVDALLGEAPGGTSDPPVCALVAPHAGFAYSGRVAARGFATLRGRRFSRVVLIGPSHHATFRGLAAPDAARYATPLGELSIDAASLERLRAAGGLVSDDGAFRHEHSLEAELPFLQRALAPGFLLVPLLVSRLGGRTECERAAQAIRTILDAETLLVVSSDFTHYGPRFEYVPFATDVESRIESLDREAMAHILERDAAGFEAFLSRTRATICGRDPLRLLIDLLPEPARGRLAAYDTSGRITGSFAHSVSYASLTFHLGEGAGT